jgi:ABC-type transport system involved in multi-copper enzyme maturation permease subunit
VTQKAPAAAPSRAFFNPGGFAKLDAKPLSEGARLRWLIGMFARLQSRSLMAKLTVVSFPLGALLGAVVLAVMTRIPQLMELLGNEHRVFVTEKAMPILFGMNLLTAFLQTTIWVAPVIAADVQSGALLLYFSRPLRRRDYLFARFLAATLVTWLELASAAVLLVVVLMATFGVTLDGGSTAGGLMFWLLLALGEVLVSLFAAAVISAVALGCSAVARSTNGAPLLFAGLLLGSIPLSLVLGNIAGGGPVWQALNLSQALNAVHELLMRLLSPQPMPEGLLTKALVGALVWSGLGVGGWQLLVRLLRNPPMGKGRA